ncbi:unnamed protein product [Rhizoctonia solani]|uniref:Histone acetyltransferase n=1 Tax=Rhizoctonia solani TaxID=456999 RepID=A0A8H3AZ88_9AGAM|nr:unnamed protein product [Rhizoctonia solani]
MALNSSCWVLRNTDQGKRGLEYYVHYEGRDKRLDEWVPTSAVRLDGDSANQTHEVDLDNQAGSRAKKRNRTTGPSLAPSDGTPAPAPDDEINSPATIPSTLGPSLRTRDQTEAAQHHITLTAQRNFDRVCFGQWSIKTWYYSPYPSFEDDTDTHTRPRATPEGPATAVQAGAHSTTQLTAGGATPAANHTTATAEHAASSDSTLWVCDRCFKYMREANAWELHKASSGCSSSYSVVPDIGRMDLKHLVHRCTWVAGLSVSSGQLVPMTTVCVEHLTAGCSVTLTNLDGIGPASSSRFLHTPVLITWANMFFI